MKHVHASQKHDRQRDVHKRSANRDQEPVPAWMVQKLTRIVAVLIHRILAAHLDVSTERNRIDAVVGFAFAETHQAPAETNCELLDPDSQELGHRIVAKLMDQNHEAENDGNRNNVEEKLTHILRSEENTSE